MIYKLIKKSYDFAYKILESKFIESFNKKVINSLTELNKKGLI